MLSCGSAAATPELLVIVHGVCPREKTKISEAYRVTGRQDCQLHDSYLNNGDI
jgi:hypothetical protein